MGSGVSHERYPVLSKLKKVLLASHVVAGHKLKGESCLPVQYFLSKRKQDMLTLYRVLVLLSIVSIPVSGMFSRVTTLVVCIVALVIMVSYLVGSILCIYLPYSWTCDWAGTHRPSTELSFDGCSQHSICCKCDKDIMQDGQGNWF